MKLYKISQTVNNEYDTYDSAIVAASSPKNAALTHPSDWAVDGEWDGTDSSSGTWCNAFDVKVEYIGEAKKGTKAGVIVASFNAG